MQIAALLLALFSPVLADMASVRVEIKNAQPSNARVTKAHSYDAQVTLSIEAADGSLTPSGWSTRKAGGGDDRPFSFQPGKNLIQGCALRPAQELNGGERPGRLAT